MELIDKILVGLFGQELLDKLLKVKWFDMFTRIIEVFGGIGIIYAALVKLNSWPINDVFADTVFDIVVILVVLDFGLKAIETALKSDKNKEVIKK